MTFGNFNSIIFIGLGIVLAVLVFGIINLGITGDKARSRSNKLMRLRVIAQFAVVILLVIGFWLKAQAK